MSLIEFTLNRRRQQITVDGNRSLLWVLRTDLGLTGTKYGCGEGFCGACTVVLNGRAARACRTRMHDVAGGEITTIEGLDIDRLHPLQQAFLEHEAFQCGFCTPGMLLAAYALLKATTAPTREQIVNQLDGNLCRCGAHMRVLAAVEAAVAKSNGGAR